MLGLGMLIFIVFFLPKSLKYPVTLMAVVAIASLSGYVASKVLFFGERLQVQLAGQFLTGPPTIVVDQLSAYFMLVISFTVLMGIIYAKGYLAPYYQLRRHINITATRGLSVV